VSAPVVYKSTDSSAPVLSGTTGSLVALLDACLVNGYGSKSAAGWTKAFTATNKGSYLGTTGHYLDVDDSGAGAAGAQEANVRGYETMSAVATGTGPFPTTSQQASPGLYVRKSVTADATARAWILVADGLTFYLFVLTGDNAGRYYAMGFGRFYSFKSSDTYRSLLVAHTATGASTTGLSNGNFVQAATLAYGGLYVPRVLAGTGTSVGPGLFGIGTSFGNASGQAFTGPNPADSNLYLSRLLLSDNAASSPALRGYLRGLYQLLTSATTNDGDTFSGTGDFAGRTFLILNHTSSQQVYAIETTAWDSST
jgi:hypothetical protein